MNVLNFVALPPEAWANFMHEHPDVRLMHAQSAADLARLAEEPEIIFGNVPEVWAAEAAERGCLRWMQSVSAGTESYDALSSKGVILTSARGVHHEALAEHVLTMMLTLTRGVPDHIYAQREHEWRRRPDAIRSIKGSRVGIIGYGGIGKALTALLQPFNVEIVGARKGVAAITETNGVSIWPMERLDELLSTSDHVVLCLPLLEEYRGLIDARRIALLKVGAYFYNVARSALVDQAALLQTLAEKRIAGSALDVFDQEPLPVASEVWDTPNLLITPHIAGHDSGLRRRCLQLFQNNFERYIAGLPLFNQTYAPKEQPRRQG